MTNFNLDEDVLRSSGIEIKNIVAKLEIGLELDLSYLSSKIANSSYEPERYSSLVYRPIDLSTVLITRSGILLFTGSDSIDDLEDTYRHISDELEEIGIEDTNEIKNINLVNVVSTFELSSTVDLNYLSISLGLENIEYEPEQFPGLIYRIENGPVVLIFSSGSVVITGATSTEKILNAARTVQKLV